MIGYNVLGAGREVDAYPIAFFDPQAPQGIGHKQNLLPQFPEGCLGPVEVQGRFVRIGVD